MKIIRSSKDNSLNRNTSCVIDLTKTSVLRETAGLSCLKEINI